MITTRTTLATSLILTLAGLALAGCPGGEGAVPRDFAGTYTVSSTTTSNFEGYTDTSTESFPLSITEGSASDLVINDPNCALPANIVGDSGIHVPSTVCTIVEDGGSLMWTVSGSGTVVDGTFTLNLSGPATISSGGASITGTVTLAMNGSRL